MTKTRKAKPEFKPSTDGVTFVVRAFDAAGNLLDMTGASYADYIREHDAASGQTHALSAGEAVWIYKNTTSARLWDWDSETSTVKRIAYFEIRQVINGGMTGKPEIQATGWGRNTRAARRALGSES